MNYLYRYHSPQEELRQRLNDLANGRYPGEPLHWKGPQLGYPMDQESE